MDTPTQCLNSLAPLLETPNIWAHHIDVYLHTVTFLVKNQQIVNKVPLCGDVSDKMAPVF